MAEPVPAAAAADAAIRLGVPVRAAPAGIHRLVPGRPVAGPVVPCRHLGSVDVFLEAIDDAPPGGVMVIENGGRNDEGCIGDLTVAEMQLAGLAGVVVDGAHRDSAQLRTLGFPVWSRGSCPVGPRTARPPGADRLASARIGDEVVSRNDVAVADDDGIVFVAAADWPVVLSVAEDIARIESAQAERIEAGTSLRDQLAFDVYLRRRVDDPDYDLRRHLRETGGAIET